MRGKGVEKHRMELVSALGAATWTTQATEENRGRCKGQEGGSMGWSLLVPSGRRHGQHEQQNKIGVDVGGRSGKAWDGAC